MKVHFFVGSEFSNSHTDFDALSLAYKDLLKSSYPNSNVEDIIVYSCQASIDNLSAVIQADDIIIAASAGGHAANKLLIKLAEERPLIKSKLKVIGFEPYGLQGRNHVVTLVQHDDPKQIGISNPQHYLYKLTNSATVAGNKNLYGHAFYSVRPSEVKKLEFDTHNCKAILDKKGNTTNYIIISQATLKVGNTVHHYNNLVAKIDPRASYQAGKFTLETTNSRVLHYDFIIKLAAGCASNQPLEQIFGTEFHLQPVSPLSYSSSTKLDDKSTLSTLTTTKKLFKENKKIITILERLEKGANSHLPYWMNSSMKLNKILSALQSTNIGEVDKLLKDKDSALSKAINWRRIPGLFTQLRGTLTHSREIVENKRPLV